MFSVHENSTKILQKIGVMNNTFYLEKPLSELRDVLKR